MFALLQVGIADLIALAGALVLVLGLLALAGVVYQHLTGGIEWPDEDDEDVRQGDDDDEWDYY